MVCELEQDFLTVVTIFASKLEPRLAQTETLLVTRLRTVTRTVLTCLPASGTPDGKGLGAVIEK